MVKQITCILRVSVFWTFSVICITYGRILCRQLCNIWLCLGKKPHKIARPTSDILMSCHGVDFPHWCYSNNFILVFKMVNLTLIMITAHMNKRINYEVHDSYWCKHLFPIRSVPGSSIQTMLFTFHIEYCTLPGFRYNYFT